VPIILGRVSDARLRELADAARLLPYSYDEVGATRRAMPPGYRVDRYSIVIGGPASFDRAVEGLRRWEAHRGAGARVGPSHAPLEVGQTVVVAVQLAVVTAVAPCRVVYVIDEGDRFGFAYGTLEGHPESGEESFTVSRGDNGVTFEVASFSRPASRIAQLGRPVARRVQTSTTRRYLTGLKSFVDRA
jgi:uncharacterized protein (UPF0548 family)